MIFNSIDFLFFFPLVFIVYWLILKKNIRGRNLFLLSASYFFYGVWDYRFLALIFICSLSDYWIGLKIDQSASTKKRRTLLIASVAINIGILGFFKYFNFFVSELIGLFEIFGVALHQPTLSIILPVGISFYTFQTLSYTLDIYRKELKPTTNAIDFFAFVSFFPQLVAGPIERARDLLPQFETSKTIDYAQLRSGFFLILWGLFKKIVIADRLALYVDQIFANGSSAGGMPYTLGAVFFAIQLYVDFSAYSEIAIGIARTLGFNLTTNFKRPYLSTSFSSFWKRWHITLSSWFKDYLYLPLGGNRQGKLNTTRNVLIVFLVSGLWHGASWNFVIWGAINGLFLLFIDRFLTSNSIIGKLISNLVVVSLWTLSLVFFRAPDLSRALQYLTELGFSNLDAVFSVGPSEGEVKFSIGLLLLLAGVEIFSERRGEETLWVLKQIMLVRWAIYLLLLLGIIYFGAYGIDLNNKNFIYFQF